MMYYAVSIVFVANIYGGAFAARTEARNEKTQTTSGLFGCIFFLMHHGGSGDVTRTHDTPGMNENCHAIRKPRKHAVNWLNAYTFHVFVMPMICSKIHDLLLQCSKDAVKCSKF